MKKETNLSSIKYWYMSNLYCSEMLQKMPKNEFACAENISTKDFIRNQDNAKDNTYILEVDRKYLD